jgi:DNA-binding transcriptional MerR regulator
MRSPENFVEELVQKGVHWAGILSVARGTRKGIWYKEIKDILLKRKLMPENEEEAAKQREAIIKKQRDLLEAEKGRKTLERKQNRSNISLAGLRVTTQRPQQGAIKMSPEPQNEPTKSEPKPETKPKKPKSEFAIKVAGMTLEQLIEWAKELEVPQEKIDQHKSKPAGLAKMNISNLIRSRIPKP